MHEEGEPVDDDLDEAVELDGPEDDDYEEEPEADSRRRVSWNCLLQGVVTALWQRRHVPWGNMSVQVQPADDAPYGIGDDLKPYHGDIAGHSMCSSPYSEGL